MGHGGLDGMGMGNVQKIHDGGSEEMVKDTGGGRRGHDGWAVWVGVGVGVKKVLLQTRHKQCAKTNCLHLDSWSFCSFAYNQRV